MGAARNTSRIFSSERRAYTTAHPARYVALLWMGWRVVGEGPRRAVKWILSIDVHTLEVRRAGARGVIPCVKQVRILAQGRLIIAATPRIGSSPLRRASGTTR